MPGGLPRSSTRAGSTLLVEAVHPVHLDERLAHQELARWFDPAHTSAHCGWPRASPCEAARICGPVHVREHRHLGRIVVHLVVRSELVIPLELPGIRVQRDHAIAVQIVAEPVRPSQSGAGFPVPQYVRFDSGSYAPVFHTAAPPRLPRIAAQVSFPGSPGSGIVWKRQTSVPVFASNAAMIPRRAPIPAGRADDHFVLDHQGSVRDRIAVRWPRPRPWSSTATCRSWRRPRRCARPTFP